MMLTACLAVLLLNPAPARTQPAVESEILAAEERLAKGLLARDATVFDEVLAPEFVLRGAPDVPRATWIANARDLCWGDQFTIEHFRVVRASPTSAVATFVLTTNRDPLTCEPAVIRSLLTDVWKRRNGSWQLVLRHSGPADDALTAQFARAPVPAPRWERSAELSLVATGGNTRTQTAGLAGSLVWRPGPWTTTGQVSFVRSETAGVQTARTLVGRVRQARSVAAHLDVFGRADYLTNEFAGIDHRISLDAGLGWKILDTRAHSLRADAGFGYSYEARLVGADVSFALVNLGSDYRWRLSRSAALTHAALFTASLDVREDWRLGNTLSLTTTMTRVLSLKLAHELKYTNVPAPGFQTTDTLLSAALVLKF